jgi:transposase
VDADTRQLLFMTEGRKAEAFGEFLQALEAHGGSRDQIKWVCMDMSKSYRKGAREVFPEARIVFDRFHVMQLAGKALDEVRKELQREGLDLKDSLWALRGNEWNLSEQKRRKRKDLCREYTRLGRAMMLRDLLQDILATEDIEQLRWWCTRTMRSRLDPFKDLVRTIRRHWDGITAFMETRLTNGLIEAINGLLQLAKRMARGFRSFAIFRTMAYLKAAHLNLHLPNLKPT